MDDLIFDVSSGGEVWFSVSSKSDRLLHLWIKYDDEFCGVNVSFSEACRISDWLRACCEEA